MGLYSDKLWAADKLIRDYNQQLIDATKPEGVSSSEHAKAPDVAKKLIDSEKFIEKLVLYGGVADELLRQCTWEDLENCGLPRLLARKVAAVFRKNAVEPDYIIKKWMPLLKKWGLHWRDHKDLAEKLESAFDDIKDTTSQFAKDALNSGTELVKHFETIRDEHLEKAERTLSKLFEVEQQSKIHKIFAQHPSPSLDGKIHQFYKVLFKNKKDRDEFVVQCESMPEIWNQSLRWMLDAKDSTYVEGYVAADAEFIAKFETWLTETTGLEIE